jgi:xanthine/CO dehydrogenase XdhC/CoxF family maturation factor
MTDLERILPLWRELETGGAEYVLATVVAVEGSSYRKPGARMILAQDGRRAGTVSGGCLEAEVARRCWWLTTSGPVVERYSTVQDDGDRPYGSGCGGVVSLLLERGATAGPLLAALEAAFHERAPLAVATVLEGPAMGRRAVAGLPDEADESGAAPVEPLRELAARSLQERRSIGMRIVVEGVEANAWADYRPARPGLWVFGAGDDARPLVRLARELGWFVAVADGRSNLAARERFPEANQVGVLSIDGVAGALAGLKPTDAAVAMTHSFEQDARILAALFGRGFQPGFIGVLGPRRRTREVLAEAARLLGLPLPDEQAERWLAQVHAPVGLDLGAESPATIALSIVAEIQMALTAASALPLSQVRGDTGCGKTPDVRQEVSGHDFSRAVSAIKS